MKNHIDRNTFTHAVSLPSGRTLTFEEYGTREGAPVLFLGAAPSSRLLDPDPEGTLTAEVRLLTLDRPGYGTSSPLPEGQAPSWGALAEDVRTAIGMLGVERVSVVGWSNGGIGALALAARHPEVIDRVVVVGTPAPHEEVPWIPEQFVPFLAQLREDPDQAVATLAPMMDARPSEAVAELASGEDDERTLADPQTRAALAAMLAEAYRQGGVGVATDIVATKVVPWGFELADVAAPVALLYGSSDPLAPDTHGAWYASRLRDATLQAVDGTGHLLPLTHWAHVMKSARASQPPSS